MKWPWQWFRHPPQPLPPNGTEAAKAAAAAREKLARAQAQRPEVERAVNRFAAEVEAAMARRKHP